MGWRGKREGLSNLSVASSNERFRRLGGGACYKQHMAETNPSQKLEIENSTSSILQVSVEMYADRYLLNPRDIMVIEADIGSAPYTVVVHDRGVQVYPGNDCGPPVTINGVPAEPVPWPDTES